MSDYHQMYSTITIVFGHFPRAPGRMSFLLKCVSYPNFVRGLLFDDMQPLVDHFEVLGTLFCTIREVLRHAGSQNEALLCNP